MNRSFKININYDIICVHISIFTCRSINKEKENIFMKIKDQNQLAELLFQIK